MIFALSNRLLPIPSPSATLPFPNDPQLGTHAETNVQAPFVKPTPTSHATAAAEFARQVFPRYLGLEHKQDPDYGRAIIDT